MDSETDRRAIDAWIRRLSPAGSLTPEERAAVDELTCDQRPFHAQQVLLRQGEGSDFAVLVLRGVAARQKETVHGRRQIISMLLPGDLCSGGLSFIAPADFRLVALSDGRAAWISVKQIIQFQTDAPGLMLPLARSLAEEVAITREWVVNVGARSGPARVAHLLCELMWRMEAVGLADGRSCELPVRQLDLADAVGLSPVHLNRILQQLRKQKIVQFADGQLDILNADRLEAAAGFDPAYLEVRETEAASLAWRMFQLGARQGGDVA
jgi:CRP-like cAMP-binding protein